jgi:hypothetical protein
MKHATQKSILNDICQAGRQGTTTKAIRATYGCADVMQYVQWYIDEGYIAKTTAPGAGNWTLKLNEQHSTKTATELYNLRYPSIASTVQKMTDATVTQLVQAAAQEAPNPQDEPTPQADTYTEQIDIERMANQMLQDNGVLTTQVGGDHYKKLGIYQPWQVLAHWLTPEELRGFAKGTVIAYLARERDKGGDDDIAKAQHTLALWHELKDSKQRGVA